MEDTTRKEGCFGAVLVQGDRQVVPWWETQATETLSALLCPIALWVFKCRVPGYTKAARILYKILPVAHTQIQQCSNQSKVCPFSHLFVTEVRESELFKVFLRAC